MKYRISYNEIAQLYRVEEQHRFLWWTWWTVIKWAMLYHSWGYYETFQSLREAQDALQDLLSEQRRNSKQIWATVSEVTT